MALALAVALYIYTSPLLENVFRRLLSCQNFAQRNPAYDHLSKVFNRIRSFLTVYE